MTRPHPASADQGEIEERHRAAMNALAAAIDDLFNGADCKPEDKKVGFFLTCWNFGEEGGRFNYISNAEKLDVRAMLKDVIARIEGRMVLPGLGGNLSS